MDDDPKRRSAVIGWLIAGLLVLGVLAVLGTGRPLGVVLLVGAMVAAGFLARRLSELAFGRGNTG